MQRFKKENIKEVKTDGEKITIEFQKKVTIDKKRLQIMWQILRQREEALFAERENIQKIARKANIKLE